MFFLSPGKTKCQFDHSFDALIVPFDHRLEPWRCTHRTRWSTTVPHTSDTDPPRKQTSRVESRQIAAHQNLLVEFLDRIQNRIWMFFDLLRRSDWFEDESQHNFSVHDSSPWLKTAEPTGRHTDTKQPADRTRVALLIDHLHARQLSREIPIPD